MTWKYGLKRKDNWLRLCEIYGDGSYTDDDIEIGGEDYQEIVDNLRMIIEDLTDPTIIDEERQDD